VAAGRPANLMRWPLGQTHVSAKPAHLTEQSRPARRNTVRLAQITLVRSQIAPFND